MPIIIEGVTLPEYNDPADVPASLKKMLEGVLPRAGGILTGILGMGGNRITNLGTPTATTDAATKAYVDALGAGAVPAGVLVPYAGAVVPGGWLLCNGALVSRTTYAGLFAAIGTVYNPGDGSTTFGLPDLRGRFPMGVAVSGTGSALGQSGGSIDHVHSQAVHSHTGPSHTHTGPSHIHTMGTHTHTGPSHQHGTPSVGSTVDSHSHTFSDTSGGPSSTTAGGTGGGFSVPTSVHTHSVSGTTSSDSHSHNTDVGTTGTGGTGATGATDPGDTAASGTAATGASGTAATGNSAAVNTGANNPPYLAVQYLIKV